MPARRLKEWPEGASDFLPRAFLDADGDVVPTDAPDFEDRAVDVLGVLNGEEIIVASEIVEEMIETSLVGMDKAS